jgi:hypothetical protein
MRTPRTLTAVPLVAAGALFGWLAASGRLASDVHAQDKAQPGGKAVPVTADNYIRRPRKEILEGTWKFPEAQPMK